MGAKVLMIEHDPDDRKLTEETFRAEGMIGDIQFIYGVELSAYLEDPANRPPMILLSMNAQPYNGMDLIRKIRDTEGYQRVPVIVLSESASPDDVASSYSAGATSFILKPASYSDALFKMRSFINYWFRTVELPA
ncbi:response regulator [Flavitalea sp. BT771]|jgi:DNA-binding response OmpR family regulator|uniref:response regulator n=1 Tax=Flavitalea sp. BT771 TaxID=3063329 RepID=UPI0026E29812|nr:response regulator [Flavitalea sp. BT771]MDO6434888.1 response regulator [Flavitalea sp. BT771]MDV6223788.1 response regulator [Flavitalea sp. BT771]